LLSPILENYLHKTQYAKKGKKIWELNCVIRDIFEEMNNESYKDAYLVRVDFQKAFDSIEMNYLYAVMKKMGLPSKFINIIKSIDSNLSAKIVINGKRSKLVNIRRGTRQGDPLSMDKFTVAVDPLIVVLNNHEMITKYMSKSNKEFLTLVSADDMTVVTNSLTSLLHIKSIADKFSKVSGLVVNSDKTKGFFFNNQNIWSSTHHLPFNHWNENLVILGIPYGSQNYVY